VGLEADEAAVAGVAGDVDVAGLVFGKPLGVLAFSWGAARLGLATRPPHLSWPFLTAGAFLAGIGFTMSLFIANLAFDPDLLGAAKLGILMGSAVSAVIGLLALLWLGTRPDLRRSGTTGEV